MCDVHVSRSLRFPDIFHGPRGYGRRAEQEIAQESDKLADSELRHVPAKLVPVTRSRISSIYVYVCRWARRRRTWVAHGSVRYQEPRRKARPRSNSPVPHRFRPSRLQPRCRWLSLSIQLIRFAWWIRRISRICATFARPRRLHGATIHSHYPLWWSRTQRGLRRYVTSGKLIKPAGKLQPSKLMVQSRRYEGIDCRFINSHSGQLESSPPPTPHSGVLFVLENKRKPSDLFRSLIVLETRATIILGRPERFLSQSPRRDVLE